VLALVLNAALASRPRMTWLRAIVTGSILVLIASTVDETTNLFSPYRTWSTGDLAANCLGILCLGIVPCACFAASPWMRFGNAGQHER
jgi:VanZ family protein